MNILGNRIHCRNCNTIWLNQNWLIPLAVLIISLPACGCTPEVEGMLHMPGDRRMSSVAEAFHVQLEPRSHYKHTPEACYSGCIQDASDMNPVDAYSVLSDRDYRQADPGCSCNDNSCRVIAGTINGAFVSCQHVVCIGASRISKSTMRFHLLTINHPHGDSIPEEVTAHFLVRRDALPKYVTQIETMLYSKLAARANLESAEAIISRYSFE